jgi:hypothetical protein
MNYRCQCGKKLNLDNVANIVSQEENHWYLVCSCLQEYHITKKEPITLDYREI